MSGGTVPYHLRQHKAIDRGVFIDLLLRLSRGTEANIRKYRYVGFAGPFAEDFKLVHSHLGLTRFVSVELDESVLRRQRWNTPLRGIDYRQCSARDYIAAFEADVPSIVWLDYTKPGDLVDQLAEIEALVAKLVDYDIVKITFNASHKTLGGASTGEFSEGTIQTRIAEAKRRLGDYLPSGFNVTEDDVDRRGYPPLILKGAEHAIKAGMAGKSASRFQLLSAFTYSDSAHRMMTIAGIVLPRGKVTSFLKGTGVARWKLAVTKWGKERTEPIDIAIPQMSLRERLFVDQQLPRNGSPQKIMRKLGFRLADGGDEKTIAALGSYRDFYRYFPYFSRVVV